MINAVKILTITLALQGVAYAASSSSEAVSAPISEKKPSGLLLLKREAKETISWDELRGFATSTPEQLILDFDAIVGGGQGHNTLVTLFEPESLGKQVSGFNLKDNQSGLELIAAGLAYYVTQQYDNGIIASYRAIQRFRETRNSSDFTRDPLDNLARYIALWCYEKRSFQTKDHMDFVWSARTHEMLKHPEKASLRHFNAGTQYQLQANRTNDVSFLEKAAFHYRYARSLANSDEFDKYDKLTVSQYKTLLENSALTCYRQVAQTFSSRKTLTGMLQAAAACDKSAKLLTHRIESQKGSASVGSANDLKYKAELEEFSLSRYESATEILKKNNSPNEILDAADSYRIAGKKEQAQELYNRLVSEFKLTEAGPHSSPKCNTC